MRSTHFDRVYNLACAASSPRYQADPIHTMLTNVVGAAAAMLCHHPIDILDAQLVGELLARGHFTPPLGESFRWIALDERSRFREMMLLPVRPIDRVSKLTIGVFFEDLNAEAREKASARSSNADRSRSVISGGASSPSSCSFASPHWRPR